MREDSRTERILKKEILNPGKVSIEKIPGTACRYNVFENGANLAVGATKIEITLEACRPCRIEVFSELEAKE